jgi:hypothetical protein
MLLSDLYSIIGKSDFYSSVYSERSVGLQAKIGSGLFKLS